MSLKFKIRARGFVRTQITKLCDFVDNNSETATGQELRHCKTKLEQLSVEVKKYDSEIASLVYEGAADESKDGVLDAELAQVEKYSDNIIQCLNNLSSLLDSDVVTHNLSLTKLKLPDFPLPEYSHCSGESLTQFFCEFRSSYF